MSMSSYFCFDSTPANKYNPSCLDEDYTKPLLPQEVKKETQRDDYPGFSRTPMSGDQSSLDSSTVLIKTGGNALQAVDRSELERKDIIAVTVPENTQPGDTLLVMAPDGSGNAVTARIPEGHGAGRVFFVTFAPPVAVTDTTDILSSESGLVIVPSADPSVPHHTEQDLELVCEGTDQTESDQQNTLVLVTVPEGSLPGDIIRVLLPDQRIVEAMVPAGGVQQFYVQAPPSRNAHGNEAEPTLPAFT
ncbi:hypothetical protein MHU86_22843 [Fragilaria crotonensis]|nr:hypothetical protein MHU86_22843 [Fragilaria crotonensis]